MLHAEGRGSGEEARASQHQGALPVQHPWQAAGACKGCLQRPCKSSTAAEVLLWTHPESKRESTLKSLEEGVKGQIRWTAQDLLLCLR